MKIKTLLIIVFSLLLVGAGVLGVMLTLNMKKDYEAQLVDKDLNAMVLQSEIDSIGQMVTVYQTAYAVKSGIEVKEEDLEPIQVPAKVAGQYIQDTSELVGNYYLINIAKGTPLVSSMILPFKLDRDMRLLDIVVDEIPIGLEVDDYVDIRIAFKEGEDFICMSNKQVAWVGTRVLKLVVNERDIHVYESMKVDASYIEGKSSGGKSFVNKVYAIEYVEGGSQEEGIKYYPIRPETLAILVQDPNIGEKEDLSTLYNKETRNLLNDKYVAENPDEQESNIQAYKTMLSGEFAKAKAEYDKQTADRKKEEEKAAKEAAKEAAKAEKSANTTIEGSTN